MRAINSVQQIKNFDVMQRPTDETALRDSNNPLGFQDALRLLSTSERLAGALLSSPESFAEIFALNPAEIQSFYQMARSKPVWQSATSAEQVTNLKHRLSVGANGASLNIFDALYLAAGDDRFAGSLFSYPDSFIVLFDLNQDELHLLKSVSPDETVEQAIAKIRAELERLSTRVDYRAQSVKLDVNDLLSLCASDARFAAAVKSGPKRFAESFRLSGSDLKSLGASFADTPGNMESSASKEKST
jgi:hypothetical protein